MAFDFYIDESTNDISFKDSDIRVTESKPELLKQRLSTYLRMWAGEWFMDLTFGIPYRQKIMSGSISKEEVDSEFMDAISRFEEVNYIVSFASTTDASRRSYALTFTVNTSEGDESFILIAAPPGTEVEYPEADESVITIPDIVSADDANKFYNFIHVEFPYTTPIWIG